MAKGKEPEENKNYKIDTVEAIKTQVQAFSGYRVKMSSTNKKDTEEYATMLWQREIASVNSKLGAFLQAFIDFYDDEKDPQDTDNWIGHEIKIVSWKMKNREIKVIS